MKTAFITAVSAPLLFLSACASTPDPAEVCSAEWITPRAERAMDDFKKDTRSTFKSLKKVGEKVANGDQIGPLQMFSVMNSINKLGKTFENGRAMKDMRTLANTCDDPDLIKTAMTDFMREQGIEEKFINFLNGLQEYQKLLETGRRPDLKI
ncbi:MAG: hypothetical protein EX271_02990 [Acidimicrobiales bacterium]|nr:hypothetical protein [Hyphomonadaceae bacterium]RZV43901.1 MAG: hypothetical protein EX271_02990 [Acidimicrobiales bacterium]